jgi:hypothetical protein
MAMEEVKRPSIIKAYMCNLAVSRIKGMLIEGN